MKEITYRNENGILIPNLRVPENKLSIGKYGIMRKKYLKQNRRGIYSAMLLKGNLMKHLHDVDVAAREQIDHIVSEMAKHEEVNEKLKNKDPQRWTGLMNNFRHCAEEVVLKTLIFG